MNSNEIPKPITVDYKEEVNYHIVGWNPFGAHKPIYAIEKIRTPKVRKEATE